MKPSAKHLALAFIAWLISIIILLIHNKELAIAGFSIFWLSISVGHVIVGLIMMYIEYKDKYK